MLDKCCMSSFQAGSTPKKEAHNGSRAVHLILRKEMQSLGEENQLPATSFPQSFRVLEQMFLGFRISYDTSQPSVQFRCL